MNTGRDEQYMIWQPWVYPHIVHLSYLCSGIFSAHILLHSTSQWNDLCKLRFQTLSIWHPARFDQWRSLMSLEGGRKEEPEFFFTLSLSDFSTIPGINCHRALAGHLLSFLPDFPPFLPHQGGQSLGLLLFQFSLIVPKTEG